MFFTNIKRVVRSGFTQFWRNGFISLAAILMMVVTLFVIGSLVFNNVLTSASLTELSQKVDINVYFITKAEPEDVIAIQKELQSMPEVESAEYISREEVLERFQQRHANDELMLQALKELGDNPFGATINIRAKDPSQYESIATFLESDDVLSSGGNEILHRVNYNRNKVAISKLTSIIQSSESNNLIKTLILIVLSIVIIFTTIRLTIFVSRDEISVMKLVGASNAYIRGPFVVVGALYGLIAGVVTIILFYPVTYKFGPLFYPFPLYFGDKINDLTLFDYYIKNFGQILLIVIVSGVVLGAIASYLAVRRYLKI